MAEINTLKELLNSGKIIGLDALDFIGNKIEFDARLGKSEAVRNHAQLCSSSK
jgi:hypothetical protein